MYNLPKAYFKDTIQYIETEPTNGWGKPGEVLNTEVYHVKAQTHIAMDRSQSGISDKSRALVYVHPRYSSFVDFKKDNVIKIDNQEYVIRTISEFKQPTKQGVHHWRLELV